MRRLCPQYTMAGQRWWRMIPLRPVAVVLVVLFCLYSVVRMTTVSSLEFLFQQRLEVLAGLQMKRAKLSDKVARDRDVLYVVKACRKFQARSQAIYSSWGNKVSNVIFSTDVALDQIPAKLQRTVSLADPASQAFMRGQFQASHAASCAVTILNLGMLLAEKQFAYIKWLVIVDDDTFVIKDRLAAYMSTMDYHEPFYLGFSNAEPLYFLPGGVRVAATAPGVAYSRGILDMLRRDSAKLFTRPATFDLCRQSQMGDDVAIGLLVWFQYGVNVTARPDLRGFHWRKEKDPVGVKPITIHTEQQFMPGQISRLKQLTDQYYPAKA